MLARLLLLFVTVPLLELALLVWMGERLGLAATLALVVVTGILGASLARWQGLVTLGRFRAAVAAGRTPHRELIEGLLVLVAAAVLLTPGLLTDVTGFLLLIPPLRHRAAAAVERWIGRRWLPAAQGFGTGFGRHAARGFERRFGGEARRPPHRGPTAGGDDEVIDVEVIDVDFTVRDGDARAADEDRSEDRDSKR